MSKATFVEKFLVNVGLAEYVPVFAANKIEDQESLNALADQPELLVEVIAPLGHRIKFLSHLRETKNNVDDESKCQPSTSNTSPPIIEIDSNITSEEIDTLLKNQDPIPNTEFDFVYEVEEPPAKKGRLESNILLEQLQKEASGRLLIAKHASNKFDNAARCELAKKVINAEFGSNTNKAITQARFFELRDLIADAFTGEEKTNYYMPSVTRNGEKKYPQGKLYDYYCTLTKQLRKFKLRENRKASAPVNVPPRLTTYEGDPAVEAALVFLREELEPRQKIEEKWKLTIDARIHSLTESSDAKLVRDYFEEFKVLKQDGALELLEIDFDHIYPDASSAIYERWSDFRGKVQQLLQVEKKSEKQDYSDLEIILGYVKLFPVIPLKLGKGKAQRIGRADIQDGFILHVTVIDDLPNQIDRLTKLAQKWGTQLQPLPVIVGLDGDHITDYYVVIDQKPYRCQTLKRTLDLTFKAYHALHCKYPEQSARLWYVLQKTLYGLNTPYDQCFTHAENADVIRLIGRLKI